MPNENAKHRERVREEFRESGADRMPDYKLLEFLLFGSIRRGDTKVLARRLLSRFGSIKGVMDAPLQLLMSVEGIGETSAMLLKVTTAIVQRYMDDHQGDGGRIVTTAEAKEYMRYKFIGRSVECVYMACIGANGKVIFHDMVVEGSPETVEIRPADIIRKALLVDTARLILAHNHPNGIASPSVRDVQTTSLLYQELKRVDIELFDHIIVVANSVCSMRETGMMPSKAWGGARS